LGGIADLLGQCGGMKYAIDVSITSILYILDNYGMLAIAGRPRGGLGIFFSFL